MSPDHSTTTTSHIPNSQFTIGALAFLCSQLVSATKRAATVVQQCWRQILARRDSYPWSVAIVGYVLFLWVARTWICDTWLCLSPAGKSDCWLSARVLFLGSSDMKSCADTQLFSSMDQVIAAQVSFSSPQIHFPVSKIY